MGGLGTAVELLFSLPETYAELSGGAPTGGAPSGGGDLPSAPGRDPRLNAFAGLDQYAVDPEGYFPGGVENATPEQLSVFIYDTFLSRGHSPDQAWFAVQVATRESDLIPDNVNPNEPGPSRSLGLWQLWEGHPDIGTGLLQDFYDWAERTGENVNPFDPISTTRYVANFTAGNPEAWNNWTAARQIMENPSQNPFGGDSRTEFPSEQALRFAQTDRTRAETRGLLDDLLTAQLSRDLALEENRRANEMLQLDRQRLQEDLRQNRFERAADQLTLAQTTQQLADARKRFAVDAMIASAPFLAEPDTVFPHRAIGGPGQVLGGLLGANVAPTRIPTQTLPLERLVGAPEGASLSRIEELLNPLR